MSYNKKYKLKLYPLTPIHVGTGESISPGEYMIEENQLTTTNGNKFWCIRVGDLAEAAVKSNNVDFLLNLIDNDYKTWLRKAHNNTKLVNAFIQNSKDNYYMILLEDDNVKNAILEKYYPETVLKSNEVSQLLISSMYRNYKGIYIPGSSIKGAIRTGLAYSENQTIRDYKESIDSDKDRFKDLKISDTDAMRGQSKLYKVKFYGNKKEMNLADYREMSKYSFELSVSLDFSINILNNTFDMEKTLKNVSNFYKKVKEKEEKYWLNAEDKNIAGIILNTYKNITDKINEKPNMYLIRLGWGVGLHSVSLNLMQPDKYYQDPITRKYVEGQDCKMPLGWALIEVEDEIKL